MENKLLSIREMENTLGADTNQLRKLLETHSSLIARIDRDYENDKTNAKDRYDRAFNDSASRYRTAVNTTQSNYQDKVDQAKRLYNQQSNTAQTNASEKVSSAKSQQEREVRLRGEWSRYIDAVHSDFESAVDRAKQEHTNHIKYEYESLIKRKNQSVLGEKGKVSYAYEAPALYAFAHMFKHVPDWLSGLRIVALIAIIIWVLAIVISCTLEAFRYYDISSSLASGLVVYGIFCVLGYIVLEIVICFTSALLDIQETNALNKANAEQKNDKIISDKQSAARELMNFENKYKSIFFHGGRWDWNWVYYPISRTEADELLRSVKRNRTAPDTGWGIAPYTFTINYSAL